MVLLYTLVTFTMFIHRLKRCNKTVALPCIIPIYYNPLTAIPMLIGLFRPIILLPDREYTNEQLRVVLLHELIHMRRKDVLIKWLSVLMTALHWFNPILPDADTVLSITMNQYDDYTPIGEVATTDKHEIAQILSDLSGASKRWGMAGNSINDYPVVNNFLVVEISTQNGSQRLRLYTEDDNYIEDGNYTDGDNYTEDDNYTNGGNYIDEPYIGVYRAKQRFDYMYSLYSAYRHDLMPNAFAIDATRPVVTLYAFDQTNDNGDPDQVKRHFTSRWQPDLNTGMTTLTDMIFIDVRVPVGSVSMQTYYAETGEAAYRMTDTKWSHPHPYSPEELFHPSGGTFRAGSINPEGFTGSIWAVTTDADGVAHTSDVIPVTWVSTF